MEHAKGQIALFILSLVGVGISIYLTSVHYENAPLVCSTSGIIDCARVLSSSYSVVPGTSIPITIPGLLWSVVAAGLAVAAWRISPQQRRFLIAELVWMLAAMGTVLYLVYVEIVRIHTICAWCTALHIVILAMFLISLVQIQHSGQAWEEEQEEEKPSLPTIRE